MMDPKQVAQTEEAPAPKEMVQVSKPLNRAQRRRQQKLMKSAIGKMRQKMVAQKVRESLRALMSNKQETTEVKND